jgi:hypothetical protein
MLREPESQGILEALGALTKRLDCLTAYATLLG